MNKYKFDLNGMNETAVVEYKQQNVTNGFYPEVYMV